MSDTESEDEWEEKRWTERDRIKKLYNWTSTVVIYDSLFFYSSFSANNLFACLLSF